MDILLKEECVGKLCEEFGRGFVADCIRTWQDSLRDEIAADAVDYVEHCLADVTGCVENYVRKEAEYSLKKVCNATGIILHTNLGRAPLGKVQMEAIASAASGYSNLEYDLEAGKRGKRFTHYADMISKITGAEAAVAVNNNAASLTLIFGALAKGREVIVSRGESIEIGGRFRIPEVVEQSGAVLKEVGTTNRTRISDYENAISENTAALLKVHTSNYRVVGFTEEASLEELVALGERYQIPVIMDLGSGVLVNLENYGLAHEPTVQEQVKKGADLVCFSGDKLLGGPQAGVIVGKKSYVQRLENYPLMRAVRLDKCIIAALSATFRQYFDEGQAVKHIPVLSMIARNEEALKKQAEMLLGTLQETLLRGRYEMAVEKSLSMVGGGSLPGETMPSYAVTLKPMYGACAEKSEVLSCEKLMEKLRQLPVPVIAHVKEEKVWLDMRTVSEGEAEMLGGMLGEHL